MRVSPRACVRESHFGGSGAVEAEIVGPSADDDTRKCREMAGKTLKVALIFNATCDISMVSFCSKSRSVRVDEKIHFADFPPP